MEFIGWRTHIVPSDVLGPVDELRIEAVSRLALYFFVAYRGRPWTILRAWLLTCTSIFENSQGYIPQERNGIQV